MLGIPDISQMMGKKRRNGSISKGVMWFALGAALGAGVSRMRNQKLGKHWSEADQGPVESGL